MLPMPSSALACVAGGSLRYLSLRHGTLAFERHCLTYWPACEPTGLPRGDRKANDTSNSSFSLRKARNALGWQSKIDIEAGFMTVISDKGVAGRSIVRFLAMWGEAHNWALGADSMVDVEIRQHNREAIETHPLARRIKLVEGSSVDSVTVSQVESLLVGKQNPLVILDSNHSCPHVLAELDLYQHFVRRGSYLLVLDTIIDDMPEQFSDGRPWGPGRGPKAAVHRFLQATDRFVIDQEYNDKLLISVAPDGFLRCVGDP